MALECDVLAAGGRMVTIRIYNPAPRSSFKTISHVSLQEFLRNCGGRLSLLFYQLEIVMPQCPGPAQP